MKARTLGIIAAAGLAALVGGCKSEPIPRESTSQQTEPENHISERTVTISPTCIEAEEAVNENGILKDSIRWCQNKRNHLIYWVNNNKETVSIYAKGTLTNPDIYFICMPFDGCFFEGDAGFESYISGARKAWQKQCERFNCQELQDKWERGEFN
ncbi:MAG: hypothetical protein QME12_05510 [Nanoarchaeota archaeon]|nr:hypothetical protein [Nanoarchaeota archaeon]